MDIAYFFAGRLLQHSAAAVAILALVTILDTRSRRNLMPAIDTLAWLVIVSGGVVGAFYLWEGVSLMLGKDLFSKAALLNRATGNYAIYYWSNAASVIIAPQLFWIRRCRSNVWLALVVAVSISAPPLFWATSLRVDDWPPAVEFGQGVRGLALETF
ncbi:MAG: hypothetical protein ACR2RV_20445 [Verrucomicrobiales bacterium]